MINIDDQLDSQPKIAYYGPGLGENYRDAVIGALDEHLQPGDAALSPDLAKKLGLALGDPFQYRGNTYRYADHSYISPNKPNVNTIEIWKPEGDKSTIEQAQPAGSIGGALNPGNFSLGDGLSQLDIPPALSDAQLASTDTGIPGVHGADLVPIGIQNEESNAEPPMDRPGDEETPVVAQHTPVDLPPPVTSIDWAKADVLRDDNGKPIKNADGSVTLTDGVTKVFPDKHIEFKMGNKIFAARSPLDKPIDVTGSKADTRQIVKGPDGKQYLVDKANNQSEAVQFPPAPAGEAGDDVLAGLSPGDIADVKAIVNYTYPLQGRTMASPEVRRLMTIARQYDPSFNPMLYQERQRVLNDYTSGKSFNNIKSLNTAVSHLANLKQAGEALQNGDYPLVNQFVNLARQNTGDPRIVDYNAAKTAVTGELASVFKNAGATDQEIHKMEEIFNAKQSPAQLNAGINQAINLMKGRLEALSSGYERGMGKPPFKFIDEEPSKVLHALGHDDIVNDYGHPESLSDKSEVKPASTPTPNVPDSTGKVPGRDYTDPTTRITKTYLGNGQWSLPK